MKAMILAAGLGTRLKPFTDKHPKALVLVNGKSLLQRNIEYLQNFGIKNVIVNVHHFAEQIIVEIEKNNGWGSDITISDERNEVLETGGGLKHASWFFNNEKNFVLMNADVLTDLDLGKMIQLHESETSLATLAVSNRKSSRCFLFDEKNNLKGWKNLASNETKPQNLTEPNLLPKAFSGIHVIDSKIFSMISQTGKFSMVDVYLDLMKTNVINGFNHSGAKFIDVGKPESIAAAEEMFK